MIKDINWGRSLTGKRLFCKQLVLLPSLGNLRIGCSFFMAEGITGRPRQWGRAFLSGPEWWRKLTPEQQQAYIEKKQAQKAEKRKNEPERVLRFNPKYPWLTKGVNDSNRADWLAMIHKKNPWLKVA